MGRNCTGIETTWSALRLEMSYLLKKGLIKKGCEVHTSLKWTSGANIRIETSYNTHAGSYIRLIYTSTDQGGNKTNHDYKIYLVAVTSNLGKGHVLYFQCPVSGNRCRVLYMCYGSLIFKSRLAYQNRIYYPSQKSSKMDHANDRFHNLEKEIALLKASKRNQFTYKGKPTKFALRLQRLEAARTNYNEIAEDMWQYKLCKLTLPKYEFKRLMKAADRIG